MNIVVVEKIEMTNNQIKRLKKLGNVTFYDDLPEPEEALKRLKRADIAIIDWADINPVLDKLQKLKFIELMSTAYNFIDIKKTKKMGIKIANIPEYATEAVAEHIFGLILSVIKKIPKTDKDTKNGIWNKTPFRGWELKNKILGIVGLGHIGIRISEIAQGFGMKVIAYDIKSKNIKKVEMVEIDKLFRKSDIITINCYFSKKSKNLITKKQFNLMKPTAIFIDASAPGITNMNDLAEILEKNKIYGAGIDVLPENTKNHPLFKFDNVVLTPHVAFNTKEAVEKRVDTAIDNIEAFIDGRPKNIVNM